MFNFLKKKESKPENPAGKLRAIYMGNVNVKEWPPDDTKEYPWSLFVEARNNVLKKQNPKEAERIYRQIVETPELETRHYMQAWLFLRYFLKVQPPEEVAKKVYGAAVEVHTSTGVMLAAGYADHSARTLHSSGGGTIWDHPDHSLDEKIDTLIQAAERAIVSVPLTRVDIAPTPPEQPDTTLICIFTPSGIYQGFGPGAYMWQDQYAGPIVSTAGELLKALEEKRGAPKQG